MAIRIPIIGSQALWAGSWASELAVLPWFTFPG